MLYLRICLTFIYFQRLNWSSHEQPHLLELQYLVNPLEIYYENFQEVRRNNPALDKVFILWHASGTTHSQGCHQVYKIIDFEKCINYRKKNTKYLAIYR